MNVAFLYVNGRMVGEQFQAFEIVFFCSHIEVLNLTILDIIST